VTRNGIIVGASLAGLAVLSFLIGSSILNSGRIATIDGFQRTADPTKIVVVLTIGLLDDRHAGAEAGEGLAELAADRPAPEHDKALGQLA